MKSIMIHRTSKSFFQMLILTAFCTIYAISAFCEEAGIHYEDDIGFLESPSRSEQAKHALMLEGEKAVTLNFKFPQDTQDERLAVYGIDVSHHNGKIDWGKVPAKNVVFAVVKATEGTGYRDKRFQQHWKALKKHRDLAIASGNPRFFRGAYHFFTPSDPKQQALDFIRQVGEIEPGDLPPTLDIEWTSFTKDRWKKYNGSEIARRALIWLHEVEKHFGRKPIIYTNAAWWNERGINNNELTQFPLWVANYSNRAIRQASPHIFPKPFDEWTIWQFTEKGYFRNRPNKLFDVNRFKGGIEELYALVGLPTEISLHYGIHNPDRVKILQDRLVKLGLMTKETIGGGYGSFGRLTKQAVISFQHQKGLDVTGIVDEIISTALKSSEMLLSPPDSQELPMTEHCTFGSLTMARAKDGQRKLALVVGVKQFKSSDITPLNYTTIDANRFYDALIERWEFPRENVCLLLDEEATIENVRNGFRRMTELTQKQGDIEDNKKDVVVFYASTHGSQVLNNPEDQVGRDSESTGKDSTLLLYDSWYEGTWDLVDDELDGLLAKLYDKTPNVTVVIDSCHSGSMTKGAGIGQVKAATVRPEGLEPSPASNQKDYKDGIRDKIVYLSAAQDVQVARELPSLKQGIFTEALLRVSASVDDRPLTYEKLKVRIENDMRINKREQIPVLTGPGDRIIFGSETRARPGNLLWVQEVEGNKVHLRGTPMPGLGPGALFSVFDDTTTASETRDSSKVKALLKITKSSDVEVFAEIISDMETQAGQPEEGDFAVLIQTSTDYQALRIRLRPDNEIDGLSSDLISKVIHKTNRMSNDAMGLIKFVEKESEADFELALLPKDDPDARPTEVLQQIVIRSGFGEREMLFDQDKKMTNTVDILVAKLQDLNLQKKYIMLEGLGGNDFQDGNTLKVEIIPSEQKLPVSIKEVIEAKGVKCGEKMPSQLFAEGKYLLPVCSMYRVQVTYKGAKTIEGKRLYVGLVTLGSSGDVNGFPNADEREAVLMPGDKPLIFPMNGGSYVASPPLRAEDVFVVIGTQGRRDWQSVKSGARDILSVAPSKPLTVLLKNWTVTKVRVRMFDPNAKSQVANLSQ